ncbi:MAG: DnaD domain protein [Clostridiales bacterium]|nr:DnaD domain protein [Clostridiales bacterium]
MPFCSFADGNAMYDVTPVENLFIREYLTHAPGDCVRVYLYALMLCYHPDAEMDAARMARALDLTEDEVASALRYWERQGALTRVSDKPPAYRFVNLKASLLSGQKHDGEMYRYRDFNNRLQALFGADRLLQPHEYAKALEWVEDLKLPADAVLALVKARISRHGSRFSFKSLDKVAVSWAEAGVRTMQDAEGLLERESLKYQAAQQVLKQFRLRRGPTADELELARKWLEDWGLTTDAILAACRETVKATNPSFGYLDSVLAAHQNAPGGDVGGQLTRQQALRDEVKAMLRALGAPSSNPAPEQIEAYQKYRAAGFDAAGIALIAGRVASRGSHSIDELDRALTRCVELKLFTEAEISQYLARQQAARQQTSQVLTACGLDRAPTAGDAQMLGDWLGFSSMELILFAARCAVGTQLPMRYIDRLLRNWRDAGISDPEAAARAHANRTGRTAAPAPALQYEQRTYREGELDELFVDFGNEAGGGKP